MPEEQLILLLGSNMGDKERYLEKAILALTKDLGKPSSVSSIYRTKPWGNTDQSDFVNQALVIPCRIRPQIVLEVILEIEQHLGRIRYEKWGPRVIDIDIIFYGQQIYQSDLLEIPHPYMQDRTFVLQPLNEIVPSFNHPLLNKTVTTLLEEITEKDEG